LYLLDAVSTKVLDGQGTSLQHSNRNLISGPDFFGPDELLGGYIRLGKGLEGISSVPLGWQCSNAGLKVTEVFESC
jgi:hypothetical protein